ncbi:MAG: SIS domain-containing protein, partial [Elusimicrobia bacterium]|nr:SIS domain-containing protein [Elusimicrobiota bacterium]
AARCVVLGRGFAYPAALEIALKLKESAGLAADGGSAADYLHGPVAAAGPGLTALLLGPRGPGLPSVRQVARRLRSAGAELLALSGEPSLERWSTVSVDAARGWPEPLSAIPLVALGQLCAHGLALWRGLDPDRPSGLAKVTRTW